MYLQGIQPNEEKNHLKNISKLVSCDAAATDVLDVYFTYIL